MIRYRWTLLFCLAASGCGSGGADDVGGVSASEARALNEAAAELDAQANAGRADAAGLNPATVTASQADHARTAP